MEQISEYNKRALLFQKKITNFLDKKKTDVIFTDEEVYHEMHSRAPYFINLSDVTFFDGNNSEIAGKAEGYLRNYWDDLMRPAYIAIIPDDAGNPPAYTIKDDEIIILGGKAVICDAHHRKLMFLRLNLKRFRVFFRTDLETMSEVRLWYLRMNESFKEELKDKHNMGMNKALANPDGDEAQVLLLASEYGFTFGDSDRDNIIDCFQGCVALYKTRKHHNLKTVFYIMRKLYNRDKYTTKLHVIRGLSDAVYKNKKDPLFEMWVENYIIEIQTKFSTAEDLCIEWKPKESTRSKRGKSQMEENASIKARS